MSGCATRCSLLANDRMIATEHRVDSLSAISRTSGFGKLNRSAIGVSLPSRTSTKVMALSISDIKNKAVNKIQSRFRRDESDDYEEEDTSASVMINMAANEAADRQPIVLKDNEELVFEETSAGERVVRVVSTAPKVVESIPTAPAPQPKVTNSLFVVATLLVGTLGYAVWTVLQPTDATLRKSLLNKNRQAISVLSEYLPSRRHDLTQGVVSRLSFDTGFSNDEIFRKYLRFLLEQRKFDQAGVDDLVQLRMMARVNNKKMVEIFQESAQRTYGRYGVLMLNPTGMTAKGLQKKAAGRALFAKLMYLADSEALLPTSDREGIQEMIKANFGASNEDTASLRIYSLTEMDADRLEAMMSTSGADATFDSDDSFDASRFNAN